jgi:hypothetical protein
MTSQAKIDANRRNAKASRGPRTAAGRARSTRNALRHGLSTISARDFAHGEEITGIAKMACGDDSDPALFEQAVRMAECDVLLRFICAEMVAAIDRVRHPMTLAWKRQERLRRIMPFYTSWQQEVELSEFEAARLKAIVDAKVKKYGWADDDSDRLGQGMEWASVGEPDRREVAIDARDEFNAMHEALPDLERLARYERRARSRLKRATLAFIDIKLSRAEARARLTPGERDHPTAAGST